MKIGAVELAVGETLMIGPATDDTAATVSCVLEQRHEHGIAYAILQTMPPTLAEAPGMVLSDLRRICAQQIGAVNN